MNPGELDVLITLLSSVRPRDVLEIGVNEGRTAKVALDHIASIEHYQGVDVHPGYVPLKACQRGEVPGKAGHMAAADKRFELILRSRGSLDLSKDDLRPCDAMFIDGDHGRRAVIHDTRLGHSLVRPGGIIVWHDYHNLGKVDVRAVLDEFAASGCKINHVAGTWLAYEMRD